jgi:hypothetical protein
LVKAPRKMQSNAPGTRGSSTQAEELSRSSCIDVVPAMSARRRNPARSARPPAPVTMSACWADFRFFS